jgi:DNA-directed RNA polymerase I subunit RPA2
MFGVRKNEVLAQTVGQRLPSGADKFVPESTHKRLKHLVAPHVDSFNYFLENGLTTAVADILPLEMQLVDGPFIKIAVQSVHIANPFKNEDGALEQRLTPREARERGLSYCAKMTVQMKVEVDGHALDVTSKAGDMPIMVMSKNCHMRNMNPEELCFHREEANECGGYFIVNGIERVIRLLQVPRRNYAAAIERSSYKNRGASYSEKGVAMRCVRADQSSVTVTLHYLNNGGSTMKFVVRKQEFLVPVVLIAKALVNLSDKELYDRIMKGDSSNTFLSTRLELLLRDVKQYALSTRGDYCAYLGSHFRGFLPISERTSDEEAGDMLIDRYIFVHTYNRPQKLECLIHMLRKLYAFAQGTCSSDNADALMNHEILLPGHLINMQLKEKIEETLINMKQAIVRDFKMNRLKSKYAYFVPHLHRNLSRSV